MDFAGFVLRHFVLRVFLAVLTFAVGASGFGDVHLEGWGGLVEGFLCFG